MTFDELLGLLPYCDEFTISDSPPAGVQYVNQAIPRFVAPDLEISEELGHPADSQILIVSAPGAVGKSTLAKAIAFKKRTLLWDLASAPEVASGSLNGMLYSTMGAQQTDFLEFLREGLQFVIVDALDEGRIKVNENSFRRLLEDFRELARGSREICFVLLGRTRIAEEAWLVSNENGVNASMISIEPFDTTKANEYIDNSVSPEKRTGPFYECRDLIFGQLAFSVAQSSESNSAREFLHYPPVLDVVATLLKDEPNLFGLKNSLADPIAGTQDTSIALLQRVIVRILERERDKILPAIKQALQENADQIQWSDWTSLYAIDEQCKRLLGSVFSHPVSAPDGLPDDLSPIYEASAAIVTGLAEHPFLQGVDKFANRVFESYLYARALRNHFGYDLKQFVTENLLGQEHLPTRLLAEFYLHGNGDEVGEILPEHLGIVYDSLISSESQKSHLRLSIDGPDPLETEETDTLDLVEVDFEFLTLDPQGTPISPQDPITFSMRIGRDSRLSFSRYLRDAMIAVPSTIELGLSGEEFEIGPAVHIVSRELRIQSDNLIVGGNTRPLTIEEADDRVILETLECTAIALKNRPTVYESEKFLVSWPGSERFPWTEYNATRSQADFADNENLMVAYRRFKRIATTFRSHGKGTLARTRRKIDHQRVLQGDLGQQLLVQLRNDEILTLGEGGTRYFWNSEKADELLGISWQALRSWEMSPTLRDYLSNFIEDNRHLY